MTRTEVRALSGLGGNMGDRNANLCAALRVLAELDGVTVHKVSHCYETEPMGCTDQPLFLNLAVEIGTVLEPLELLAAVKQIEGDLGRTPTHRWGPREIDIDIVLWGTCVLESDRLTLPHKEFRTRAFVLEPLAEIAGDAVDPVTGATVAELASSFEAQGAVTKLGQLDY